MAADVLTVLLEGKPIGNVERLAAGALRLRYDEGYRDDPTATLFSSRCSAPRLVATVLEPCSSAHPLRLTILSVDPVRSRGSPRPPLPQDCGRFKPTRPAGSALGSRASSALEELKQKLRCTMRPPRELPTGIAETGEGSQSQRWARSHCEAQVSCRSPIRFEVGVGRSARRATDTASPSCSESRRFGQWLAKQAPVGGQGRFFQSRSNAVSFRGGFGRLGLRPLASAVAP